MKKEQKALIAKLEKQGWEIKQCGSGHIKAIPADKNMPIVIMSSSASDMNAIKAMIKDCKKSGFDDKE